MSRRLALIALCLVGASLAQTPQTVNSYLELPVFPRATVTRLETGPGNSSEAWLRSGALPQAMYGFYDQRLRAQGWTRLKFGRDGATRIQATYGRVRTQFDFDVERVSREQFKLEFNFTANR
jgi:hypothetical protein